MDIRLLVAGVLPVWLLIGALLGVFVLPHVLTRVQYMLLRRLHRRDLELHPDPGSHRALLLGIVRQNDQSLASMCCALIIILGIVPAVFLLARLHSVLLLCLFAGVALSAKLLPMWINATRNARAIRKDTRARGGRVCVECGYSLAWKHADYGPECHARLCPECGAPWERDYPRACSECGAELLPPHDPATDPRPCLTGPQTPNQER